MEGREVETATGGSGEGIVGLKRELDVVEGNEMVWAIIVVNRLLLSGRDLLNRDTSVASLAIDIRRVITDCQGVFCMGLEDCRFEFADGRDLHGIN